MFSSWADGRRIFWALAPLLLTLLVPGVRADDGDALRERLFVVRAETADVALQVTSLRGGDSHQGVTDADGQLLFVLRVAHHDEIRFVSASRSWKLDWVATVRNAHLDPDIPLELDVAALLHRADVKPIVDEGPEEASKDGSQAREPLRCGGRDDIVCLLRLQRQLAEARNRGDCRAALRSAQQLSEDAPDFARSDPAVVELASLHLECALIETATGDPYERRELLLRRAVSIAAGIDGSGWCDAQRSRVLAAAHSELRETAAAAATIRRTRKLCPGSPEPVEWEYFFRLGLGQLSRAAEVAQDAASVSNAAVRDLGTFLAAWSAAIVGECPDVEPWLSRGGIGKQPSMETPCRVLPEGTCARARTDLILRCGDDAQLAAHADALRGSLDEAQPWQIEDLAEVEATRGSWDEVARLFGELRARFSADVSPRRLGVWDCRQGDALLRAGRPMDALGAFEAAASTWRPTRLSASHLDQLVVENNALVLAGELRGPIAVKELDSLAERVRDLDGDAKLDPWRLAVENNLLELRMRIDLEGADSDAIPTPAALERIRDIESAYRHHVRSVVEIGSQGEAVVACAQLVFAGDLDLPVEETGAGERE